MKTRLLILVSACLLTSGLLTSRQASASQYETFGNDWYGDCAFASLANVVRYNWPDAPITTAQVLAAWNAQPQDPFGYMVRTGFGGHRLSSFEAHGYMGPTLITQALRHGGLVAWLNLPIGFHAEAIVGVGKNGPIGIYNGWKEQIPWKAWQREIRSSYTFTWLATGSESVSFETSPVATPFATVVTTPGSTVSIPSTVLSEPSLIFCGWSTMSSPPVLYVPGSSATFPDSTVLYPVYFAPSEGCGAWSS